MAEKRDCSEKKSEISYSLQDCIPRMTSLPDYKQMEMNVMNLKKLSVLKKQQEMKYISTSSYSERPKKDKDAELEDDKLLSQEENISHHQTLSPQRDEPILHAETVKVEDQSTAKKLSSFDRPQYLNDKSQPSYQSLRSNYHRNGSLFQDHPNSTIQDHFVTAKPLLRDVDEEESIRELDEYLGDQEHCHRNPDAMSFQDRQSTGHWSSTRHPEARRTESLQSYYPHQDRQYLSKADNYENLRNYQKNPEPNYHSVKNSECFNSCSKQSDPARNLKDQFYQSIKVPQQPYSSDNQGLTSLSHLLSSSHDWKNIQEVVRIAFKYVTDSFNSQQNQLKYLYSELDSKASKSELSSRLSNKASQSDINKCYADCAKLIETKQDISDSNLTNSDWNKIEQQFIDKSQIIDITEKVRKLEQLWTVETQTKDLRKDLTEVQDGYSQFIKDTKEKLANIQREMSDFVVTDTFQKALESKANKHSVATALHRKANKKDIEEEFKKLIRNNEFNQIIQLLENKASNDDIDRIEAMIDDQVQSETIDELRQQIMTKATTEELEEILEKQAQDKEANYAQVLSTTQSQLSSLTDNINSQFEYLREDFYEKLATKMDSSSILELTTKLSKKTAQPKNVVELCEKYKKQFSSAHELFEQKCKAGLQQIRDLPDKVSKNNSVVFSELDRLQNQRDQDLGHLKETIEQLYEESEKAVKQHEYQGIIDDIKNLGKSLQEIEGVMMKEIFSKSGTLSSQIDLKRSILSPKGEDENIMQELNSKQNNDHIEIQEFQKQKNSSNSNINSLRTDIEKELSRQKEETIDTIESAKAEIYENLDEILQNHVNALQEEKLLLLEEDHGELSSPKSGTGLDNNFSEDSKPPLAHMESHSTSRAGRDNH